MGDHTHELEADAEDLYQLVVWWANGSSNAPTRDALRGAIRACLIDRDRAARLHALNQAKVSCEEVREDACGRRNAIGADACVSAIASMILAVGQCETCKRRRLCHKHDRAGEGAVVGECNDRVPVRSGARNG